MIIAIVIVVVAKKQKENTISESMMIMIDYKTSPPIPIPRNVKRDNPYVSQKL